MLLNSPLNNLKSVIKNETNVVLKLSSNMIGNSNDETNFPPKLFLTYRRIENLCKVFANYTPVNIKLSKIQIPKMIQSGGFLGRLLGLLLKTGLPLIKNVIKPLTKSALILSGLTGAASAEHAGIHKKLDPVATVLIISYDEMKEIMKIVTSLEDSGLLLKEVSETIQNEAKKIKMRISKYVITYIRCWFIRK